MCILQTCIEPLLYYVTQYCICHKPVPWFPHTIILMHSFPIQSLPHTLIPHTLISKQPLPHTVIPYHPKYTHSQIHSFPHILNPLYIHSPYIIPHTIIPPYYHPPYNKSPIKLYPYTVLPPYSHLPILHILQSHSLYHTHHIPIQSPEWDSRVQSMTVPSSFSRPIPVPPPSFPTHSNTTHPTSPVSMATTTLHDTERQQSVLQDRDM